jgi:prepilin-type processing-associated H-X9-DG protein
MKAVFVENTDERGWIIGSWLMNINPPRWTGDRIAVWHGKQSNISFADGHAEKHQWVDKMTIRNARKGPGEGPDNPLTSDFGEDLRYIEAAYIPGRR